MRLVGAGEEETRANTDRFDMAYALIDLARAAAHAGAPDRAEALARSLADPDHAAHALAAVVQASAKSGVLDRVRHLVDLADTTACSIVEPIPRARSLALLAMACAYGGIPDRARRLARQAEAVARGITESYGRLQTLARMARALAVAGELRHARKLVHRAAAVAVAMSAPDRQAAALADVLGTWVGDPDDIELMLRAVTHPYPRSLALAAAAGTVARNGDPNRAQGLARQAEAVAGSITVPSYYSHALAASVQALAEAGNPERAESLARAISLRFWQRHALFVIVPAVAAGGDVKRSAALFSRARDVPMTGSDIGAVELMELIRPRVSPDQDRAAQATMAVLRARVRAGDVMDAKAYVRRITAPYAGAYGAAAVAQAVAGTGDLDHAREVAELAMSRAEAITEPFQKAQALTETVRALALAGDHSGAEALAQSITSPAWQACALMSPAAKVTLNHARRLVAAVLVTDEWQTCLDVLARIDRAALVALTNTFLAETDRETTAADHRPL
jgi:hypothetical protein